MSRRYSLISIFLILLCSGLAQAESVVLNSREVIRRTLYDSLQSQSIQLNDDIAEQDVKKALSQFDTLLRGNFSYIKDKSERSNVVFGTESSQTRYDLGVSQLLPSGTELTADLMNTKETTDSLFAPSPSFFDSRTQVQMKQPLLRNTFGFQNREQVRLAKSLKTATDLKNSSDVLKLVYSHLQIYWSWYYTQRLKAITEDALSAASRLYRTNRQKMVIGLIEESDLHAFAANVDLKSSDLYLIEANLADSESLLRSALNLPYEKISIGSENTRAVSPVLSGVDGLVSYSLEHHPDYLTMQKQVEAQNIAVKINQNSKLPQLDLTASLILNGLDPAFDNSVSDVADGHPVWQTGVQFSLPLQNRNARATHQQSRLLKTQLLYGMKDVETRLISQIQQGYRRYQAHKKRMDVVATAVEHQRLKWEGEITKYDQGRSDPDLVIRYQNDYLDTQKLYVQTQLEFQIARTTLEYVSALLLNDVNL